MKEQKNILLMIFTSAIMLNCCCARHARAQANRDSAIKITYAFPYINNEGGIYMREDSLHLYSIAGMRVYRATKVTNAQWDDITKETVAYFCYFICGEGESTGYFYDSISAQNPKVISADSFMRKYLPQPAKPFSANKSEKLIESYREPNGQVIEKYYLPVKPDNSYADTSIYQYVKSGTFFYSLNPEHDSIRQMQLCRYSFYYKEDPPLPERTFYWQLSHAAIDSEPLLLNFIERHKKWVSTKKQ